MKAIAKKSLRIAGAVLIVLGFTLTNKDGNVDGINLASFVAGMLTLLFTESETNKN